MPQKGKRRRGEGSLKGKKTCSLKIWWYREKKRKRRKFGTIRTEIKGHTIFFSSFPKESHSLKKLNFIILTREGSPEL